MPSLRCPGCGAKNPEISVKCRICGFDLRAQSEFPISQPKAGVDAMRSASLKGVMGLAVLGVAAIVLIGVLLGVLPGGSVITDVRNKVPFLASESSDGWAEFTETEPPFRATMPVDRTQIQETFPAGAGVLDEWVSTLGPERDPDTTLTVGWTAVPTSADENVTASLASVGVAWADSLGGIVKKSSETSFQGMPALVVNITGMRNSTGDDVTVRAILIRQRGELYVLSSRSVYSDHPQFDRLVNGFALL